MESQTMVGDLAVCRHIAIIKPEAGTVQFIRSVLDEAAFKDNRVIARADQAEFEDAAYKMLDDITSVTAK